MFHLLFASGKLPDQKLSRNEKGIYACMRGVGGVGGGGGGGLGVRLWVLFLFS